MSKRVALFFIFCAIFIASGFASISSNEKNIGFMKDSRDGQTYKTVKIGSQTWMAENLNFKTIESQCYPSLDTVCWNRQFHKTVKNWTEESSLDANSGEAPFEKCYLEPDSNCTKYGRLYTWKAAMGMTDSSSADSCNDCKSLDFVYPVQGACPAGWHLPSKKEWKTLFETVGGEHVAGSMLKSTTGWEKGGFDGQCCDVGNGSDAFGFTVLPAGIVDVRYDLGKIVERSSYGENFRTLFWTSLGNYRNVATCVRFSTQTHFGLFSIGEKDDRFSIRCVKDSAQESDSSLRVTQNPTTLSSWKDKTVLKRGDRIGSMIDPRDRQTYKTVKIGSQTWMAENLNFKTKYSFCYDNDSGNCKKYGRLYVWDAAIELCPAGWHLPDTAEWKTLLLNVGENGLDNFGFSALAAGDAEYKGTVGYGIEMIDEYENMGFQARFWSSTERNDYDAFGMILNNGNSKFRLNGETSKTYAYSVRCIKDYIRRKNKDGRRTNDAVIPALSGNFLTDPRDGQTYKTVKIGNQVWMAENLNFKTKHSCCYDNDSSNCTKFGQFYDWVEATEVCPKGWHLPDTTEWNTLFATVGGRASASKVLKSKSLWKTCKNWNWQNGNGSDDYGFSALPAGSVKGYKGFYGVNEYASFWSSSEDDRRRDGFYVYMVAKYNYAVYLSNYGKLDVKKSVRCIMDGERLETR